jgi:hypothetical protein
MSSRSGACDRSRARGPAPAPAGSTRDTSRGVGSVALSDTAGRRRPVETRLWGERELRAAVCERSPCVRWASRALGERALAPSRSLATGPPGAARHPLARRLAAGTDSSHGVTEPLIAPRPASDPGLRGERTEYRCATCGYGVIVSDPPRACPMCKTHTWDPLTRKPLAHADRLGTDAGGGRARRPPTAPATGTAVKIERGRRHRRPALRE